MRDSDAAHTRYVVEKSILTEQLRIAKDILKVIDLDDTARLKTWRRTIRELRKQLKELDEQSS